jgi:hypothetical protein
MHIPLLQLQGETPSKNVPAITDGRQHRSHSPAPIHLMEMAATKS